MWSWKWWRDVGERALRTFAQAFVAAIVIGENGVDLLAIDWAQSASLAGGAALVSVLTSIGTHTVTGNGPSFTSVYKETDREKTNEPDRN